MPKPASSLTATGRQRRWRSLKDLLLRHSVAAGGVGVIVAILLIFFYLLYIVLPMFGGAQLTAGVRYPLTGASAKILFLASDEHATIGMRVAADGDIIFSDLANGKVRQTVHLPLGGVRITAFQSPLPGQTDMVFGLSDGRALLARYDFTVSFPGNKRTVTPGISYPLGETPLRVDERGRALQTVSAQFDENGALLAGGTADGHVVLSAYDISSNFLTGEKQLQHAGSRQLAEQLSGREPPAFLLLNPTHEWLYAAGHSGNLLAWQLAATGEPAPAQRVKITAANEVLTELRFLIGGISLLAGTSEGRITQWFPVRSADNDYQLRFIREFHAQHAPITTIAAEHRRKGFIAADNAGFVGFYYPTAGQSLLVRQASASGITHLALGPRGDVLQTLDTNNQLQIWQVQNAHPEVSWSALWGEVWYESYEEPHYVWQSSAASNDFEPKFSLTPLVFGTLKAAFYAMLFAVPLALMGAIYTAQFMAPRLRRTIKPTVELMAAMPTVILGFLAGLWLAPLIEMQLAGIFLLLFAMPLTTLLFAWLWRYAPPAVRNLLPPGWDVVVMIPVLLLAGWSALALGAPLERILFDGNLPQWLSNQLGIGWDQRNALVVGIAMGFAVIPNIYSIAEDAIFGVPKHLSYGSLALGATPWQTLLRVVLPTASPGIFSGLMIGMGRAVGETMIVLMATGNTPIMSMNIFEGLRTLSANIAVEMPESEVGSSHYRILFLAALVLFMLTFTLNTAAEIIRQRLRNKYSSI